MPIAVAPAALTTPPAARAPGHRGVRGWAACLVALAAVPTLFLAAHPSGGTQSGGEQVDGHSFTYTIGPGLSDELAITAMAVLMLLAAGVLWRARRSLAAAAGGLLALAAIGAAIVLVGHADSHARPTPAAVNAIALGTPRAAVLRALGRPLAQATTTTAGPAVPSCLIYSIDDRGAPANGGEPIAVPYADRNLITYFNAQAAVCFVDGRLTVKQPA